MRISEAYEHEPILSYQSEDTCRNCEKMAEHCVDVAAVMTLAPTATAGTASVTCQGTPETVCVTDPDSTSCTLTVTQRLCVSVPIRFGVTVEPSDTASIRCAEDTVGGCGCR